MSIILTVGGLMMAASLPGGEQGGEMGKSRITAERMQKIEEATQMFMAKNQRRPYPADLTAAFNSASYGMEITPPVNYSLSPTTHYVSASLSKTFDAVLDENTLTGGDTTNIWKNWMISGPGMYSNTWIESINSATALDVNNTSAFAGTGLTFYFRNPIVAGAVPTKTLGLPDEYAIDGFGRRIVYMMDARVATTTGCMALQGNGLKGGLKLSNSNDFAAGTYDTVQWALLSHGKDGQGGVGIQGAALTNRIKTNNTDASTLVNAFYDGSQATSYTNVGLVNKASTATFDDMVWTNEISKNTCALGTASKSFRDFRINGGGSGNAPADMAFGDINGDGFKDIVLGVAQQNLVRVIFGKKDSWPEPNTAYDTTAFTGNNGFTIARGTATMSGFGTRVAVGDVNGDGYDDVIAGGAPVSLSDAAYAVTFGAAKWPASYTITSSTLPTTSITLAGMATGTTSHVSLGDVNNDGYDDIALPFEITSGDWAQGVIYGKASSWSDITLNTTFLNGTNGVYFNVATVNGTNGDVNYGPDADAPSRPMSAICSINGDRYHDIIIPGATSGTQIERVYYFPGAASITNTAGLVDPSQGTGRMLRFDTNAAVTPNYDIKGLACKDINSDGRDDVSLYLKNNTTNNNGATIKEYLVTWFGEATPTTQDLDNASNYDIRFNLTGSAPSWQDYASLPKFTLGDANNDGRNDIILTRPADDPYFSISGTTFTINSSTTGTQRSNAGASYILYQPSTCAIATASTCWGTTPGLAKTWFSDYTFNGTSGIALAGAVADDNATIQAIGDMNKDNKNDLLISSTLNPTGGYFVFGKTTWPNNYDLNCTRDKTGAHCPTQLSTK